MKAESSLEKKEYKHTLLGNIPLDWEVKKIDDVSEVKGGFAFNSSQFKKSGKYQVVKMSNFYENTLDLKRSNSFLDRITDQEKESLLNSGDIVITLTGTIGKRDYGYSFQITNEKNLLLNQRVAKLVTKKIISKYLFYEIKTKRFLNQFFYAARGGTGNQTNVGTGDLSAIKIVVPPLVEQKSIVNLLDTWNNAIQITTQLIFKKEQHKKWLMKNLLTGKIRLKGFGDGWEDARLGNCFEFIKSYSISREGLETSTSDQIYCVHYGDIHAFYETEFLDFADQKNIPQIKVGRSMIREKDLLRNGDVIIADASEDYQGVGEAVEVVNIENKSAVGGLHTIVLRDIKGTTSDKFRAYLFASEGIRNQLRKKSTGTSIYSITKTTLQNLIFKLPPLKEQTAIANVLNIADKEIQLLKRRTQKIVEQKNGLMQILLNGKKRLKTK